MATISLLPHNERSGTWVLFWVERREPVGRVIEHEGGRFVVTPQGPHWSPMKSLAAGRFASPSEALLEVQLYFAHR